MNTHRYLPPPFGISIEAYFILLLIGIVVFFFWRRVISPNISPQPIRKLITLMVVLVGTPHIYWGLMTAWFFYLSYHSKYPFDQQKWMRDKEKRYELSDDIIEHQILIGKTKQEVVALLGREENFDKSDNWSYYLGYRPGFIKIDPEALDIKFKNGKVVWVGSHET
ncbi:MAG: hypothetical protein U0T84_07865 [Chitinophagales bacterium]